MTDNEKAATFIGPICNGEVIYVRTRGLFKCRKCNLINHARVEWVHNVPDMNRPENYMRALNNQMCALFHDYEGWHCDLAKIEAREGFVAVVNWHKTAGEAVIAALAALYDAEHKEVGDGKLEP